MFRNSVKAESPQKFVYKPPPTPYGGLVSVDGKVIPAQTAPHLLVSGVSGSGKSRRVLVPGILMWRGPVVAISSKPDLIQEALGKRVEQGGYGHTYVIDLSGEVQDRDIPGGAQRVIVDPVALINNDDDATDLATVLIQSGAAGSGDGSGGGGDDFWNNISTPPLAALLRAADGIMWAQDAIGQVEFSDPDDPDLDEPCWAAALIRLGDISPMLARKLRSAILKTEKMRDSIMVTMQSATAPWLRSNVGNDGEPFVPDMLAHSNASLFMVAPADGVAAGAAVAVVDFISKRWRKNQNEEIKMPRLLLVVDELTNTLPWPKLPTVVTESRAMGIHLLVAVQATSQFARRYGADGRDELRDVFPATLLLVGAAEKEMLEHAAWTRGQTEKAKISVDHLGHQSTSYEKEGLDPASLLPHSKNEGRLLRGTLPGGDPDEIDETGLLVQLRDISEMKFRNTAVTTTRF